MFTDTSFPYAAVTTLGGGSPLLTDLDAPWRQSLFLDDCGDSWESWEGFFLLFFSIFQKLFHAEWWKEEKETQKKTRSITVYSPKQFSFIEKSETRVRERESEITQLIREWWIMNFNL